MATAMNIVYEVHDGLYVNLTNRCSCRCTFCLRDEADGAHGSGCLWLEHEPTADEVLQAMEALDMTQYSEVVFCGYGEPTEAFDVLKDVARGVKGRWGLPVRINTNGQGSLINGRDITPELEGLVDSLSVSLNTPDAEEYLALTRSQFGADAYPAMLEFAQAARAYVPSVTMTTVGTTITPEQEEQCRALCESLGVSYRIRPFV